jgi:hypothetical protein
MNRAFAFALLLLPTLAFAQTSDEITFQRTFLLRNASGTAANPGPVPRHAHLFTSGDWTGLVEGSLFLTHVSEHGPAEPRNEVFSTNWFGAAAQRSLGSRGLVLFRVRGSLETVTVKEEGYPQLLQTPRDRMRGQDLIGEAAAHFAYRFGTASFAHLYAGAVGDPAFGPLPYMVRASSEEFAEGPFAYDVQEAEHVATRVFTGGFATRTFGVEGGVFHYGLSGGIHDTIEDGNIDSWSARVTFNPTTNVSLQASRGSLGDANVDITSASVTYGTERIAASAIWTERVTSSIALELLYRASRNSFMVRAESIDAQDRVHVTLGYIFDFIRSAGYRAGAGVNIDYHTRTHDLSKTTYGHKPQSIYLFARLRTEAQRR